MAYHQQWTMKNTTFDWRRRRTPTLDRRGGISSIQHVQWRWRYPHRGWRRTPPPYGRCGKCYDPFFFHSFLYANPWLSTGKTTLFEPCVGHVFFFLSLSLQHPLTMLIRVTSPRLPIPDVSSLLFRLLISSCWHMQNVLEHSIVFHRLLSDSWLLYINQSV